MHAKHSPIFLAILACGSFVLAFFFSITIHQTTTGQLFVLRHAAPGAEGHDGLRNTHGEDGDPRANGLLLRQLGSPTPPPKKMPLCSWQDVRDRSKGSRSPPSMQRPLSFGGLHVFSLCVSQTVCCSLDQEWAKQHKVTTFSVLHTIFTKGVDHRPCSTSAIGDCQTV